MAPPPPMTSKYFSGGQDGGRKECRDERWTMKSLPKMSRGQIAGQVPLPDGWDVEKDVDGRPVFIDHNTEQTTWVDPRDRLVEAVVPPRRPLFGSLELCYCLRPLSLFRAFPRFI